MDDNMDEKNPIVDSIRFKVGSALGFLAYCGAIALPVYILLMLFTLGVTPETTPILLYLVVFDLLLWALGHVFSNYSLGNKLFEGMLPFGSKKKS